MSFARGGLLGRCRALPWAGWCRSSGHPSARLTFSPEQTERRDSRIPPPSGSPPCVGTISACYVTNEFVTSAATIVPPFRKKSRLHFLFVCKRTHDENAALSTFCGYKEVSLFAENSSLAPRPLISISSPRQTQTRRVRRRSFCLP